MKLFEVTSTTWESANRNAQISVIHSAQCTDLCFAICWFSQVVLVTSNNFTLNLLFNFQKLLVLIWFLFGYLLSTCCSFTPVVRVCAALLGPLHGCNSCCLWFWQLVFGVSPRAATSNLPSSHNPLSNRSVLHDGRKLKTVVFSLTNALRDKHVVQICRSSLSAAMQTVQMSVEARLSTELKSSSVIP